MKSATSTDTTKEPSREDSQADWDAVLNDEFEDDPYCLCDEQPTEEEEAFNVCSACGKPLS